MKQSSFLLCFLVLAMTTFAQLKEGKIIYERSSEITRTSRMAGSKDFETEILKDLSAYQLLFNSKGSLLEELPQMEEAPGEGERVLKLGSRSGQLYTDLVAGKTFSEENLGGQSYVVEGNPRKINWKITDETKTLLGHTVKKATGKDYMMSRVPTMENGTMKMVERGDSVDVVAWFAPDIPVQAGPDFAGQLPGLILELITNNGREYFRATEISKKYSASALKKPSGGTAISDEEFRKESSKLNEKMNEMLKQRGRRSN